MHETNRVTRVLIYIIYDIHMSLTHTFNAKWGGVFNPFYTYIAVVYFKHLIEEIFPFSPFPLCYRKYVENLLRKVIILPKILMIIYTG